MIPNNLLKTAVTVTIFIAFLFASFPLYVDNYDVETITNPPTERYFPSFVVNSKVDELKVNPFSELRISINTNSSLNILLLYRPFSQSSPKVLINESLSYHVNTENTIKYKTHLRSPGVIFFNITTFINSSMASPNISYFVTYKITVINSYFFNFYKQSTFIIPLLLLLALTLFLLFVGVLSNLKVMKKIQKKLSDVSPQDSIKTDPNNLKRSEARRENSNPFLKARSFIVLEMFNNHFTPTSVIIAYILLLVFLFNLIPKIDVIPINSVNESTYITSVEFLKILYAYVGSMLIYPVILYYPMLVFLIVDKHVLEDKYNIEKAFPISQLEYFVSYLLIVFTTLYASNSLFLVTALYFRYNVFFMISMNLTMVLTVSLIFSLFQLIIYLILVIVDFLFMQGNHVAKLGLQLFFVVFLFVNDFRYIYKKDNFSFFSIVHITEILNNCQRFSCLVSLAFTYFSVVILLVLMFLFLYYSKSKEPSY